MRSYVSFLLLLLASFVSGEEKRVNDDRHNKRGVADVGYGGGYFNSGGGGDVMGEPALSHGGSTFISEAEGYSGVGGVLGGYNAAGVAPSSLGDSLGSAGGAYIGGGGTPSGVGGALGSAGGHSGGRVEYAGATRLGGSPIKGIRITQEEHVIVEKPYPVHVEKIVPYPVTVKVPIHVEKHYPVAVDQPFGIPVEKDVPFPVERQVPYPVKEHVKIEVPTPVKVSVPKPVVVKSERTETVAVPYPVYLHKEVPVFLKAHEQGQGAISESHVAGDFGGYRFKIHH